jgi:hypothetical protein
MITSQPAPPQEFAHYLDIGRFYDAFAHFSAKVTRRIFKLERLQNYGEPDNTSWEEFQRGNVRRSLDLLRELHAKDVKFDIDFFRRGLQFLRVRAVELPLSSYVEWELQAHVVNAQYGETVLVADLTNVKQDSPVWNVRDYLLFDTFAVLIHDYDSGGNLRGGWMCEENSFLRSCSDLSARLTETSVPLAVFLNEHPFHDQRHSSGLTV